VTAFGTKAAAISSTSRAAAPLVVRGMADIAVEHGRGEWKTYGDLSSYKPGKFQVKCFNKISPVGLAQFPEESYDVRVDGQDGQNAHALLLRSHKLQEAEVAHTVRAIARCVRVILIQSFLTLLLFLTFSFVIDVALVPTTFQFHA
jgi:D-3-phosphoglycerate dehydrogenase